MRRPVASTVRRPSRIPETPDNHGDDAGNDVRNWEVTHAGGAQCYHGKKGTVIEGENGGGSHVCLIAKFACQGGIDDAVGIGYGSDDSQRRQTQESCFAKQCIEQKSQTKTDKELKGGEDNAFPHSAAGHFYINGGAAAEQKQANQGGDPVLEQA